MLNYQNPYTEHGCQCQDYRHKTVNPHTLVSPSHMWANCIEHDLTIQRFHPMHCDNKVKFNNNHVYSIINQVLF